MWHLSTGSLRVRIWRPKPVPRSVATKNQGTESQKHKITLSDTTGIIDMYITSQSTARFLKKANTRRPTPRCFWALQKPGPASRHSLRKHTSLATNRAVSGRFFVGVTAASPRVDPGKKKAGFYFYFYFSLHFFIKEAICRVYLFNLMRVGRWQDAGGFFFGGGVDI
jgi:hypothetical protein